MYQYQQPYQFQPQYQPQFQPQYQQAQQYQPARLSGRIVGSIDEVQLQEVPTDGTVALFPLSDGSCVYGKRWNADGTVTTLRYLPEVSEQPAQETVSSKLDRVLEMLDGMRGADND